VRKEAEEYGHVFDVWLDVSARKAFVEFEDEASAIKWMKKKEKNSRSLYFFANKCE